MIPQPCGRSVQLREDQADLSSLCAGSLTHFLLDSLSIKAMSNLVCESELVLLVDKSSLMLTKEDILQRK